MIKFDINKVINVVLIGLGLVYATQCGGAKVVEVLPSDYISPKEFEYRMQVIDLIQTNQNLKNDINQFKQALIKDSTFVANASISQVDSLFANYFR